MMDTFEHRHGRSREQGGKSVSREGRWAPGAALTELRALLEEALSSKRLTKTALARRAGLGRTTVSEAFSTSAPVPSAETVVALADALGLAPRPLLDLRAAALANTPDGSEAGLPGGVGRLISDWHPLDLEVHPAADPPRSRDDGGVSRRRLLRSGGRLPGYVRRPHDEDLARITMIAAGGHSEMAVLVGTSSTGKTRACWEAVQPLIPLGWRLWHPFDPTHAEAALADLNRVAPHTVVWLNEAQHYLGAPAGLGERIAAALRSLLTESARSPVLILGTLWPEYAAVYTLNKTGQQSNYPQVRELLAGRLIAVPDAFDAAAIGVAKAVAAAGDQQLTHALEHALNGQVTQLMAGGPELLHRYHTASPPGRALLNAAMDGRRLGAGLHLPITFLEQAAEDYLTDDEYDALDDDWLQSALDQLATTVHGNLAPLRRTRFRSTRRNTGAQQAGPTYRLADYLEQYGRQERKPLCPPTSFWKAARDEFTDPETLDHLARAAFSRHRIYWAYELWQKAVEAGSVTAMHRLAELRMQADEPEAAENLLQQAADAGDAHALLWISEMRERSGDHEEAERLAQQAADVSDTFGTYGYVRLAGIRMEAGDREGARDLLKTAVDAGDVEAMHRLAELEQASGNRESAEMLLRQAMGIDDGEALLQLVTLLEEAGDHAEAELLARQAAHDGAPYYLHRLAELRAEAGNREAAEELLQQSLAAGDVDALDVLAQLAEEAGDHEGAEVLWRRLAASGPFAGALTHLGEIRAKRGEYEEAEALFREAAAVGDQGALYFLAELREQAGDRVEAERLAQLYDAGGSVRALFRLAQLREKAGDRAEAERLAREAADRGASGALFRLAQLREKAGYRADAERFAREAADAGDADNWLRPPSSGQNERPDTFLGRLWPHGLDPDGTPSAPW